MPSKRFDPSSRSSLMWGLVLGGFLLSGLGAVEAAGEPEIAGQPIAEYARRRHALMEALDDGLIVILGARSEDFGEVERFRQRNNFMYLTGIERPGSILLLVPDALSPDGKAREVAFIPPRNPFEERWSGPQIGPGETTERRFGIAETAPAGAFEDQVAALLSVIEAHDNHSDDDDEAGAPRPRVYTHQALGADGARAARLADRLREIAPDVQIKSVAPALAGLRLVKSEAERDVLQTAIDITIEGHRDAARAIEPGAFEYEVQGALEYAFTRNGAERPGFASIVGSGPNSVILHYNVNRRRMKAGELVVVDVGAEYHYYTADLTRTYPVSGAFTDRQRAVYQLVLDAQKAAEEAFEPGTSTIADLHRAALQCMRDSPLRDSEGRTLDRFFMHGLGHWLGMDVHDVGDYNQPIPSGAVFTIEPGIYLQDENLGVRIEDDYLATDDGLVKLSEALPSTPEEIEAMMEAEVVEAEQE